MANFRVAYHWKAGVVTAICDRRARLHAPFPVESAPLPGAMARTAWNCFGTRSGCSVSEAGSLIGGERGTSLPESLVLQRICATCGEVRALMFVSCKLLLEVGQTNGVIARVCTGISARRRSLATSSFRPRAESIGFVFISPSGFSAKAPCGRCHSDSPPMTIQSRLRPE